MPGFLDLPPKYSSYEESQFVIVPFPMELSTSYMKGTALGPQAILDASHQLEFFDSELRFEPCEAGIFTHKALTRNKEEDVKSWLNRSEKLCSDILIAQKTPVVLGGEHTISIGPFAAFKAYVKEKTGAAKVGILHIDAHADLRDEYKGDPYSHASALRRCVDTDVQLVSIGIRSMCPEEWKFSQENKNISIVTDFDWHQAENKKKKIQEMLAHLPEHVYVTIDLDGLSPDIMPAVGTPEPGGMGWFDTLDILRATFKEKKVHAFDVNELMPRDNLVYADFLAAKLVYKMIAYHSLN
jgi:agmatinase